MSDPVRTVAICGSCITRDNFNSRFNPEHRRWYSVVAQANQSSMIALMSPPVEPDVTDRDGLSDYDTWNVRSDLSRSFLAELVEARPDYLVLDFFGDLHFGLLELPDGRYATDNRWKLHQTAQYRAWVETGGTSRLKVLEDTERYVELWTEAMDRFAAYVAENCPTTTVIVHRGFYADRVVSGPTGRPRSLRKVAKLAPLKVRRLNAVWKQLDEHAASAYGWRTIDLSGGRYTSTEDHPWGAFWVHYSLDYYHRFLAELHRIDLERRTPAALRSEIATIGAAGDELLAARERFARTVVREQAAQLARLERRGVVRTAREVLHAPRRTQR
jgi:hypothetical protein